jgi:uncharacterized CHY-type Zn-finger protein
MGDDLRRVNLAVDEATGFMERHPEVQDHTFGPVSALAFGMLKALYECGECRGVTMVPIGFDGVYNYAQCPNCQRQYQLNLRNHVASFPVEKAKRGKKR